MNVRTFRNIAGFAAASTLRLSGAIKRAHCLAQERKQILPVFFHDPPRHHFVRVIEWFRQRGYKFISLDEVEDSLYAHRTLRHSSVWISFDDAWRRNLTEILPIIRERNIPITLFVPTAEVMRGTFWFSHAFKNHRKLPEPFRTDIRQLWRVANHIRLRVIDELFERVPPLEREVMSVEEIAMISSLPQVTLGSHTATHAILPMCTKDELWHELNSSKCDLEGWTGRRIRALAYPNGDFDQRAAELAARSNYSLAFTTQPHPLSAAFESYLMPRCSIMDDGSLTENLCHAFGLWPSFWGGQPLLLFQCDRECQNIAVSGHSQRFNTINRVGSSSRPRQD